MIILLDKNIIHKVSDCIATMMLLLRRTTFIVLYALRQGAGRHIIFCHHKIVSPGISST